MLTLWQTEWCRHSAAVRQRLTELGVDVVLRQVPADPDERHELIQRFGDSTVPLLETENGTAVVGSEAILEWLDARFVDREDAELHHLRARTALGKRCADLVA